MAARARILGAICCLSFSLSTASVQPSLRYAGLAARAQAAAEPRGTAAWGIARVCTAGYLGGLAKYAVVQPLDTMTTLFEISRAKKGPGLIAGMQGRVASLGFKSLFSGLKSTAVLALPYAVVFHSAQIVAGHYYSQFIARQHRHPDEVSPKDSRVQHEAVGGMVGSFAGSMAASCVGVPMEALKHRAQVLGSGRARDLLRRVMQEEGIKGLYAGFKVTLGRNMLYNVAQWTSFPVALALLSRPVPLASSHAHGCADASGSGGDIAAELGAGFIAGVCTAMATQPLDTVNTRLQTQVELALSALRTQTLQAQAASQPLRMYSGVRDCALKVVHHEGLPALWGGLLPRSLNFGVGAAVFFVVFQRSLCALDQMALQRGLTKAQNALL